MTTTIGIGARTAPTRTALARTAHGACGSPSAGRRRGRARRGDRQGVCPGGAVRVGAAVIGAPASLERTRPVARSVRSGVVGEHEEQGLQRCLGRGEREQARRRRGRGRRRRPRPVDCGPVTTRRGLGVAGRPRPSGWCSRRGRARARRRWCASRWPGSGAIVRSSAMVPWNATVPRLMIVTLSQISSTSSMSWELSSTVSPLSASRLTRARMSRMPAGSRPLAGSSSTSSRGSRSRLAATPSRWRMP